MEKNSVLMELDDDAIIYPEYDDAIIGKTTRGQVVYDATKCMEILMRDQGMSEDDAQEWFWYNVDGAYVVQMTPYFICTKDEYTRNI